MLSSSFHLILFIAAASHWLQCPVYGQAVTDRPSQAPPATFPSASSASGSATSGSASPTSRATTSTTSAISPSAFPPLNTVSPCVADCLQRAVGATNCSSLTDVACFCPNRNYTQTLASCVSGSCPSELNSAEALAQQFCNLVNSSSSLSFPSTVTSASSLPPTSSPIVTSPTTPTRAASTTAPPASSSPAGNSASKILEGLQSANLLLIAPAIFLGALVI